MPRWAASPRMDGPAIDVQTINESMVNFTNTTSVFYNQHESFQAIN